MKEILGERKIEMFLNLGYWYQKSFLTFFSILLEFLIDEFLIKKSNQSINNLFCNDYNKKYNYQKEGQSSPKPPPIA